MPKEQNDPRSYKLTTSYTKVIRAKSEKKAYALYMLDIDLELMCTNDPDNELRKCTTITRLVEGEETN